MRKALALFTNEMIKVTRKKSLYVILIIILALSFGFAALFRFSSTSYEPPTDSPEYHQRIQEEMSGHIAFLEEEINGIKNRLNVTDEANKPVLEENLASLQNELEKHHYAMDQGVLLNYSNSYRVDAVEMLFVAKLSLKSFDDFPQDLLTDEFKVQIQKLQKQIDTMTQIVEKKDYQKYIDLQNEIVRENPALTDSEKEIHIEANNLRAELVRSGESDPERMDGDQERTISSIQILRLSLIKNVDQTQRYGGTALIDKTRALIEDELQVSLYKLRHGMASLSMDNTMSSYFYLLQMTIIPAAILVIILAGSTFATEFSSGSIKSLVIAPVKRWKIATAKLASCTAVLLMTTVFLYAVNLLAYGIFFGFGSLTHYVYMSGGGIRVISGWLYCLLLACTSMLPSLMFMVLAFMLSAVTRSTAASVGISVGILFVGNTISSLLWALLRGEWLKFIPFSNMEFTSKIFRYDDFSLMNGNYATSLTFSLIYAAVMVLCMMWIGYDSFTRRDIK